MLGNAAGTTARAFGALYPGVAYDGVEIDPQVTAVARRYFGLGAIPRLTVYTADARPYLQATRKRYDLIMIDAYRQPYVPFYLATREFFALCRRRLTPGGIVALNVSTVPGDPRLVSGIAGTLATEFPEVVVWPALRFNDLVVGLSAATPPSVLRRRRRPGAGASSHAAAVCPDAASWTFGAPLDRRPGAGRVAHRRHDRRLRRPWPADPRGIPADGALSAL
jgi:hypothetical protein